MNKEYGFEKIKNLPIYKKGEKIYDVIHQITDLIPENNEQQHIKGVMMGHGKNCGAESGDFIT